MEFKEHTTILAPGSLHLALYAKIHELNGDSLHINVMTPEAYISSLLQESKAGVLEIYYAYAKALENLSPDNVFYVSRKDHAFLQACYDFMRLAKLYGVEDFPAETDKEKDLKEILDLLSAIPLWQQNARHLHFDNAQNIQILDCAYPEQSAFFLERMKKEGAKMLLLDLSREQTKSAKPAQTGKLTEKAASAQKEKQTIKESAEKEKPAKTDEQEESILHPQIAYWSAANPRKEMEVMANAIIENEIPAEDVFIALCRPTDKRVLEQVFSARGIPLTFLHPVQPSRITAMFEAIFRYILDPSPERLIRIFYEMYYRSSADLRTYLELFPDGSSLRDMPYQENPIISASEFSRLVSLEAQADAWLPMLDQIRHWNYASMEEIAAAVQEAVLHPTEEDIKAFDAVLDAYVSVAPYLQSNEDLQLFVDHISRLQPSSSVETISGALAGDPSEISSLRPHVFLVGADAANFPDWKLHEGLFDETYLAKTSWPSLQQRMDEQKQSLFGRLEHLEHLYILSPQSDYEGKSIDASFDLNTWLGRFPAFRHVDDASIYWEPDFSLPEAQSRAMFVPDQVFHARASSLKKFQDCPLKHMLRYGLQIRQPSRLFENLQVRPEILTRLLVEAPALYNKPFEELTKAETDAITDQQFDFARAVFPDQKASLDILQAEYEAKLWDLKQMLSQITRRFGLELSPQEYEVSLKDAFENTAIEIDGSLSAYSRSPFTLLSPDDPSRPRASLDIPLRYSAKAAPALNVRYGKEMQTSQASPQENEGSFLMDFMRKNIMAQDLEGIADPIAKEVAKKNLSYEARSDDLKQAAQSFLLSLKNEKTAPVHKTGTCEYCSYRSICRNGARERE